MCVAAELAAKLLTNGDFTAPETGAQVRPLVGLNPEMQGKVWERGVKQARSRPVTPEIVRVAADELSVAEAPQKHADRPSPPDHFRPGGTLEVVGTRPSFSSNEDGDAARNILKDVLSSMERRRGGEFETGTIAPV